MDFECSYTSVAGWRDWWPKQSNSPADQDVPESNQCHHSARVHQLSYSTFSLCTKHHIYSSLGSSPGFPVPGGKPIRINVQELIVLLSFLLQALFMYWVTNSLLTTVQILVFKIPYVRKIFSIPTVNPQRTNS